MTIRAHFDGHVIVPDEAVALPINRPLRLQILNGGSHDNSGAAGTISERLERLRMATGVFAGRVLDADALRRENLYDERA